ncbi:MAG: putative sulfate exporter family transporter [Pseudomonadota bacterium]
MAADLYGDIVEGPRASWRDHLPGLAVVGAGTLAAGFLADRYGAPLTLMALLIGLALNFLSADKRLHPGLGFASRDLLRWGIVLVGTRVTFGQIAALGVEALLAIVAVVGLTIGVAVLVARRLGYDRWFGLLAGGAVAICGASAALAVATTLGSRRVSQAQLTLVLIGISAMSAAAMVLYPILAHALGLSDAQAGFLLGGSIHDVAQALGAGYSYSDGAGQIATIVKLSRVALLAPVLAVIALFLPKSERGGASQGVPWFVIGFFAVAAVNSFGVIPPLVVGGAEALAAALLACAVAATAIRSPLPQLLKMGHRPLVVIGITTLATLTLALLAAVLIVI